MESSLGHGSRVSWHRSLCGRFAIGFIGLMAVIVAAQGAVLSPR